MEIACSVVPGVAVRDGMEVTTLFCNALATPEVSVAVATAAQALEGLSNEVVLSPGRVWPAVWELLEGVSVHRGFATFGADGVWVHPLPGTMLPVLIMATGAGGGGLGTGTGGHGANTVVSGGAVTVTARGGYGGGVSGSPHGASRGFPNWGAVRGPLGIGIYGGGGSTVSSGSPGQAGEALCVVVETDQDLTVVVGDGGAAGAGGGGAGQAGYVIMKWAGVYPGEVEVPEYESGVPSAPNPNPDDPDIPADPRNPYPEPWDGVRVLWVEETRTWYINVHPGLIATGFGITSTPSEITWTVTTAGPEAPSWATWQGTTNGAGFVLGEEYSLKLNNQEFATWAPMTTTGVISHTYDTNFGPPLSWTIGDLAYGCEKRTNNTREWIFVAGLSAPGELWDWETVLTVGGVKYPPDHLFFSPSRYTANGDMGVDGPEWFPISDARTSFFTLSSGSDTVIVTAYHINHYGTASEYAKIKLTGVTAP